MQWGVSHPNTFPVKRHLKSRNPTLNIPRCHEPVATDTIWEQCGDAMTQKLLDHETQKIIYRSAIRPQKSSTPNHRLAPHGGEVSTSSDPSEDKISSQSPLDPSQGSSPKHETPTVFIRSRDDENPSGSKPMPTIDKEDLTGKTFLLSAEKHGEGHRTKVTRKVVEIIDQENDHRIENINSILDIGNGS